MRTLAATMAMLFIFASFSTSAHAELAPAAGFAVEDWATGFPVNAEGIGPVGLAVRGTKIYVGAYPSGRIYVFDQATGGVAGPAAELTSSPVAGLLTGLAFDKAGHLYGALKAYGSVVELSLVDGHVVRTVASGIRCALGLATDPLSGDLFVSHPCGAEGIDRLVGSASGPATVTPYTSRPFMEIDGIEFGADGTLYGADGDIFSIAGTDQPNAGAASLLASVAGSDGLAVAASPHPGQPPFLLTITTRGTIEKIDLLSAPAGVTQVAAGGSRGDLGTAGSDGCLYATQSDRVVKVTNSDGSCSLLPSLPSRPLFAGIGQTRSQAVEATKRALMILSLARSARTLTHARRVRARTKLVGPPLLAVRLTLSDARGRVVARGSTPRLTGTRTLTLKRTRTRVRPGLVRLRASGWSGSSKRVTVIASRRLRP